MKKNSTKWRDLTIGDLITLQRGYDLTNEERIDGIIPVFGAAGHNGFHNISKAKAPGVVVGRSGGSFGQVHLCKKDFWPHNTGLFVKDFKGNDELFVFFLLKNLDFSKLNSGSAQPSLNRNFVYPVKIKVPEIEEQKRVSAILSDLDAKIELNNKINAELEAMAKLIYDYWFVQFDFPIDKTTAEKMGNPSLEGKSYKASGGKMVYNIELKREIPEGWRSETVGDLLESEKLGGKIPSSLYLDFGTIPIIDQSSSFICGFSNDESKRIFGSNLPRIVFGDHTRILKFINFDFVRGADGTQVLLSKNGRVPQHFFYHSLLKIDLSNYGYARHFKFLKDTRTIVPKKEVSVLFEEKAKIWYSMIWQNIKQNQKLSELRDWLLPMLMNGQVRVGDGNLIKKSVM